jgi:hypothetical protein
VPRCLVERTFVDEVPIGANSEGAERCRPVAERSAGFRATWTHSFVRPSAPVTSCVCDGPSPRAMRMAAEVSNLPVDTTTEVHALDPYVHH